MEKHKEHIIPQTIQKNFTDDPLKQNIYGIKFLHTQNKALIQNFSIETSLYIDKIYENPLDSVNTIENLLMNLENDYKLENDFLIKILDEDKNAKKEFKERYHKEFSYSMSDIKTILSDKLMIYLLKMYYRSFVIFLGNKIFLDYNAKKINKEIKNGIKTQNDVDEFHLGIKRWLDSTLLDDNYLNKMSQYILKNYKPYLLISQNNNFVLSDTFISTASIDIKGIWVGEERINNRSIGLSNIYILIPINNKYYLLFTDEKQKQNKIKLNDNEIIKYNSIIYRNACEYVLGRDEKILDFLNKNIARTFYGDDFVNGDFVKHEVFVNEEDDVNMVKILQSNPDKNNKGFQYATSKKYFTFLEKGIRVTNEKGINGFKIVSYTNTKKRPN